MITAAIFRWCSQPSREETVVIAMRSGMTQQPEKGARDLWCSMRSSSRPRLLERRFHVAYAVRCVRSWNLRDAHAPAVRDCLSRAFIGSARPVRVLRLTECLAVNGNSRLRHRVVWCRPEVLLRTRIARRRRARMMTCSVSADCGSRFWYRATPRFAKEASVVPFFGHGACIPG
jgi:hypothetical protein